MGRIGTGWELTKASFSVLNKDKELIVLPLLSGLVMIFVAAIVWGGFFAATLGDAPKWLYFATLYVFYVLSTFVVVFFNAGVVAAATIRYDGGDPTVADGLRAAWSKKGVIFQWALVAATVGIILHILESRSRGAGARIFSWLGRMAWAAATYFVVPVLVFEGLSPFESLKRSVAVVKKTWGEALTGEFSTGFIFFLLGLLGLLPIFAFMMLGPIGLFIGIGIAGIYWVLLAAVGGAINGILIAGLSKYAKDGKVPSGLPAHIVEHPVTTTMR
jgi:hypothetical protein